MIASVFSKTRPINYVLIGVFIIFPFFLYAISNSNLDYSWDQILKQAIYLLIILASSALVNFISLKNNLQILVFDFLTKIL